MIFRRIKNLISNISNRSLGMLIFFVTSRCNARCTHCFNWQNINKQNEDLTLLEIEKLSQSMPAFPAILFSGGEPFLRNDLYEIVAMFKKNNGVKIFSFPTNGYLSDRIESVIKKILTDMTDVKVSVNFSIDGFASYHDEIRKLPGCFDKVWQSVSLLLALKKTYGSRLEIKTNTVITGDNINNIAELIAFFKKEHPGLDDNLFEIIRGSSKDKNLNQEISHDKLRNILNKISSYKAKMLRVKKTPFSEALFKLANLMLTQKLQYKGYVKKGWGMPCLAGQSIAVLDHNGQLRHCELRPPVENLHDYNMDFNKAWQGQASVQERKAIKKAKCWNNCTHICFVADTVFKHYRTYFWLIPGVLLQSAYKLYSIKIS